MNWSVRDLAVNDEVEFCHCLETWSDEMKESGDAKARWLAYMKDRGLGVKLAVTDGGAYAGMIQYYPVSYSPAVSDAEGVWFIHCVWVHGYKKGQGNFQKKGIGKALLKAAEKDIMERGGRTVLAWGLTLPFWMKSSWYKKRGYRSAERDGIRELVVKSLDGTEPQASWRPQVKKPDARRADGSPGVTMFMTGACPVSDITWHRLSRVAEEYGLEPEYVDTSIKENIEEWGLTDALYIGGRQVPMGPPPSVRKLNRLVKKAL